MPLGMLLGYEAANVTRSVTAYLLTFLLIPAGTESTMIDFVADSVNQFQVMEEDVYTQQPHEALDCALIP